MVLILTVVYLERLQKLYAEVDAGNAEQANASVLDAGKGADIGSGSDNASGNAGSANEGQTAANDNEAGDSAIANGDEAQNAAAGNGGEAGSSATGNYGEAGDSVVGNGSEAGGSATGNGQETQSAAAGNDGEAGNTATGSFSTTGNVSDNTGEEGNIATNDNETGNSATGSTETGNATGQDQNTGDIKQTAEGSTDTGSGDSEGTKKAREKYDYSLGLDPEKPIIALSFDDGPSIYTERIINALKKYNVQATFFMVGYNVREYKDVVRLVYDSGMEIGNHTIDHKKLTDLSKSDIKSEVFDNEDLINAVVPVGRIIVRPPYGSHNSTVRTIVSRPMFNWTVDSLDWKTRNADSIVAQIQQDARDGYIILMHDIYETTAEAAERIIPWLIDQGYQVTCISKMFKARGEKMEDGELYRNVAPAE